jgi:ribosomal protein L37AE/L43A
MRDPYHCPFCDQRSTRRWNLDVHIKRKHGEYLLGKPSERYMAKTKSVRLGHATVADSIDNTFEPKYIPEQLP